MAATRLPQVRWSPSRYTLCTFFFCSCCCMLSRLLSNCRPSAPDNTCRFCDFVFQQDWRICRRGMGECHQDRCLASSAIRHSVSCTSTAQRAHCCPTELPRDSSFVRLSRFACLRRWTYLPWRCDVRSGHRLPGYQLDSRLGVSAPITACTTCVVLVPCPTPALQVCLLWRPFCTCSVERLRSRTDKLAHPQV